jgi:hypothetical protein
MSIQFLNNGGCSRDNRGQWKEIVSPPANRLLLKVATTNLTDSQQRAIAKEIEKLIENVEKIGSLNSK